MLGRWRRDARNRGCSGGAACARAQPRGRHPRRPAAVVSGDSCADAIPAARLRRRRWQRGKVGRAGGRPTAAAAAWRLSGQRRAGADASARGAAGGGGPAPRRQFCHPAIAAAAAASPDDPIRLIVEPRWQADGLIATAACTRQSADYYYGMHRPIGWLLHCGRLHNMRALT
eukprot:360999-Chlamydomonas_euryale.AAC.4